MSSDTPDMDPNSRFLTNTEMAVSWLAHEVWEKGSLPLIGRLSRMLSSVQADKEMAIKDNKPELVVRLDICILKLEKCLKYERGSFPK